jgi:hypothetical protein
VKKLAATILLGLVVALSLGCQEKFSVIKLSPPTGVLGGGEPVEIIGTGFNREMGIAVYFGNSKASNVVVSSQKKMIVSTPSSSQAKAVDVRIATDDGKEYLLRRAFRYIKKSAMDIRDLGKRRSQRERPAQ